MIDLGNHNYIYDSDRRDILERALYSQPYFYKMEVELGDPALTEPNTRFLQSLGIDRDFYLTELQADFGQADNDQSSLYEITVYTGYNRSVYHYLAGRLLPSAFVVTDAPFRLGTPIFDDRQFENLPFLIRQNDRVYVEVRNLSAENTGTSTLHIVLKGFSLLDNVTVTETQAEQLFESLSSEVEWTVFKVAIDNTAADRGVKSYILENDRQSRLILGFGAVNTLGNNQNASEINLQITETAKRLRFSDTKIPLSFFAPRITETLDTHIYYLPIEFYWQPYSKLQFDVENIWIDSEDEGGAEISVLTRTV